MCRMIEPVSESLFSRALYCSKTINCIWDILVFAVECALADTHMNVIMYPGFTEIVEHGAGQ